MSERASNETTPIVPKFGAPDVRQVGTIPVTQWVANAVAFILTRLVRETDLDQSGLLYNEPRKSKEIPPRPAIFQEALEELRDEEMRREFEASKARAIAHLREHHAAGNGPSPEPWIKQLERIHSAEELAKGFCEVMRDCDALIDKLFKAPGEDLFHSAQDKPITSGAECMIREHGKPDRKGIVMPPNVTMALIAYGEGSITLRQLHQRIRAIEEGDDGGAEDSVDTAPKVCTHRYVPRNDGWCAGCEAFVDTYDRIDDDERRGAIDEEEALDRKLALRGREASAKEQNKPHNSGDTAPNKAKPKDTSQFCQHGHGWAYECSACGRMSMDLVHTPIGGHPAQYGKLQDYQRARDYAVTSAMGGLAACQHGHLLADLCDKCGNGYDNYDTCEHLIPFCHRCDKCSRTQRNGRTLYYSGKL